MFPKRKGQPFSLHSKQSPLSLIHYLAAVFGTGGFGGVGGGVPGV